MSKRKLHSLRSFIEDNKQDPTVSLTSEFKRRLKRKHRNPEAASASASETPHAHSKHKKHHKQQHESAHVRLSALGKPLKVVPTQTQVGQHTVKVERVSAMPVSGDEFEPRAAVLAEVRDLIELVDTAKDNYRQLPDGENAMALTALLRELRGLTSDFVSLGEDSQSELLTRLHQTVLQPMFRRIIAEVVHEHRSLRRQLTLSLGEQHLPAINREIKQSIRNYAPRMQAEYELVVRQTAEQLGVTDEVQPLLDRIDDALQHSKKA
jgi:hypothetical protein